MTPTLFGRWQTRLLLLFTVGVLVTLVFHLRSPSGSNPPYFWILLYIAVFGLGWDLVYNQIQQHRWDRDWPGSLQLGAGVWEAIFILILKTIKFPLPGIAQLELHNFILHYSLVWVAVYICFQSIMRIIFPRWRFRGGEWL